ncbi:MAG: LysR family transcriptional regulator [Parvibaculaceae bacterium]
MKVTLRQIETFLAVADAGNFSAAASRLNAAQPALSQAVKDLEDILAVRLFDRTTRRVELTEAGKEFRNSAAKIVEDLQHAVQSIHDLAARRRGRIRVAAPPLLAAAVLPQAIAEFRGRYPGITVALTDAGTETIVENVRSGRADCGLGTFPPSEPGIERIKLVRDGLMLFCGRDDIFASAKAVSWSDLAASPLVTLTRESGIRLLVEVGFESAQVSFKPAYEVSHINTALALVEAGLGVAVLPSYSLTAIGNRRVIGVNLVKPSIARDVVMIHATGRSVPPLVAAFASVVRQYAQRLSPQHD